MTSNYAWISGGVVQNVLVADAAGTFAASLVAQGLCDYCNALPANSPVGIGWTYAPGTNTYTAPPKPGPVQ